MAIIQLIASSNYITVNKIIIRLLGIDEAIILGELASEYEYWSKREELQDGYFYSTIENIEENTTLTEYKQRKALNSLKERGLIDIKIKGIPAKRFIKINEEQVLELLSINSSNILSTSSLKIKELDTEKPQGNKNNINKNNNKNNNNKKERKTTYDKIIGDKIEDADLKGLIYEFIKMRKMKKKPLTDRALTIQLNKLLKLSTSVEEQKQIVENSIVRCWDEFYPLKKEANDVQGIRKTDGSEYDFLS